MDAMNRVTNTGLILAVFLIVSLEALAWNTGESVFSFRLGNNPQFNSAYAATEIGHGGGLYSGTALGMIRLLP